MKILMVCLGNICRSPLAEGILRKKISDAAEHFPALRKVKVDSAGTGSWHVGEPPDRRAVHAAKKFDVDISNLVCRQFAVDDFDEFDMIFVMDRDNYQDVMVLARNESDKKKVNMILNADQPGTNRSVPDPYYGGEEGFVNVIHLLDTACNAIVTDLKKNG